MTNQPLHGRSRSEWSQPEVAVLPLGRVGDSEKATVWGAQGAAADSVVTALRREDVPSQVPQSPWAAVVVRADGTIVAASAATLPGGLYWSLDTDSAGKPQLIVSHDVGAVVRARTSPTKLDGHFLRATLSGFMTYGDATPYEDVRHIQFGTTALWRQPGTEPTIADWLSPERLPEPTRTGGAALSNYLETFDSVIDELIRPDEPIAATLSGGLDSSFVVASLARRATAENPVHCYTHSPHPDAGLRPLGNWDPDDYEVALAMEQAYPGKVVVHRIINEDLVDPLDFIQQASLRAWTPNFNRNGVWFTKMADRAQDLGAGVLFEGTNGNAAFSYDHPYAPGYYLRRGDLSSVARLLSHGHRQGRSVRGGLRSSIVAPLAAPVRSRWQPSALDGYLPAVGLGWLADSAPRHFSSESKPNRTGYLRWLTRRVHTAPSGSPLAWSATPVDPFSTTAVIETAASIAPLGWRQGTLPRGFARTLGQGRVPDQIRLRTRRGSQSADVWFAVRDNHDRYLDELALVPDTDHLGGWVDHEALKRRIESLPWGQDEGPKAWTLTGIHRVLGLAHFIRESQARLLGYR